MLQVKYGHIYFADLNPVQGHEQGGYRPVLVLQKDTLNTFLNTVVVAPLTKNLKAKGYLTTYFLDKKISKLKFDSVALLYQLRTIDKKRLIKMASALDHRTMSEVREQLLFVI